MIESDRNFIQQLHDYRLTTAEIIYRLPDHPSVLQSYIWQELDIAPKFPILHKFLRFWQRDLQGKLYMVKVATQTVVKPAEFHFVDNEFTLQ